MPNFAISDLAPVTLPIDAPNTLIELEVIEGGIPVSRRIAASQLGIGGSVNTVNSGVNITIDNTDPLNPIVNLDAAIAGVSVNGVTLVTAGSANNFLNELGNYVTLIPGGQVDSVVGGVNITVDAGDPINPIVNLDASLAGVDVNGVTLTTGGVATNFLDETGAYSVPPSSAGTITGTGVVAPSTAPPYDYDAILRFENANNLETARLGWNGASILELEVFARDAEFLFNVTDNLGATVTIMDVDPASNPILEMIPAGGDVRFGTLTGRSVRISAPVAGAPSIDLTQAGGLYMINGATVLGLAVTEAQLYHSGAAVVTTKAAASGGLEVDNQSTGGGFERVLTTSDLGGGGGAFELLETVNLGFTFPTLAFVSASHSLQSQGQSIIFDLVIHSSNMGQAGNSMTISWAGFTIGEFTSAGNIGMCRLRGVIAAGDSFGDTISSVVEYYATGIGGAPTFTSGDILDSGRVGFSSGPLPLAGTLNVNLALGGSVSMSGQILRVG